MIYKAEETEICCPTESYYNGLLKGEYDYSMAKTLKIISEIQDMFRPILVSFIKYHKVLFMEVAFQNSPAWNVIVILYKLKNK